MNNQNSFNYFDKIYVISDKKNIERRRYIDNLLTNFNIGFEFFDAVMGESLSDDEIQKVYDEEKAKNHKTIKRSLTRPEIGCALSHIHIYEEIISESMNNTLILEDDIKLVESNISKIYEAIEELPTDWDLLYLGTLNHYDHAPLKYKLKLLFYYPLKNLVKKMDYKIQHLWNLYPRDFSESLNKAGYHQGTHAYAISKKGAEKFLSYHHKIVTPMDYMLSVMTVENKFNAFITKERLVKQNLNLESSIEESRLKIKLDKRI